MKYRHCPLEESVSNAVRTSAWDDSAVRHAAECHFCQEIIRTSRWMHGLAANPDRGAAPLPDASLLWWRAQLAEADRKRATTRRLWKGCEPPLFYSSASVLWFGSFRTGERSKARWRGSLPTCGRESYSPATC